MSNVTIFKSKDAVVSTGGRELSDYEWTAIKPILPNKPRGGRRVATRYD